MKIVYNLQSIGRFTPNLVHSMAAVVGVISHIHGIYGLYEEKIGLHLRRYCKAFGHIFLVGGTFLELRFFSRAFSSRVFGMKCTNS